MRRAGGVGATFGWLRSGQPQNARRRGHKRQRSPEMSDSISYAIRDEAKDMDEKENECVAREAYAKTVDQQYKSKIAQYKRSKDLGRALLARLTDEEADAFIRECKPQPLVGASDGGLERVYFHQYLNMLKDDS